MLSTHRYDRGLKVCGGVVQMKKKDEGDDTMDFRQIFTANRIHSIDHLDPQKGHTHSTTSLTLAVIAQQPLASARDALAQRSPARAHQSPPDPASLRYTPADALLHKTLPRG